MTNDFVECQGCHKEWHTSQLSSTGPIKDYDEEKMEHTKKWIHICPECFSDQLKVLIRIPVCI